MAIFKGPSLYHHGQLPTKEIDQGVNEFHQLLESITLRNAVAESSGVHVVMEDYKVYGWKTEQHTWAELHTPKLIGAFIAVCVMSGLTYSLQMAVQAKQFCTDDKLEGWGLYKSGMRHARDAIRHGVYFTLFDKSHAEK